MILAFKDKTGAAADDFDVLKKSVGSYKYP